MLGKKFTAGQLLMAQQELNDIDWNLKVDKWEVQLKSEELATIYNQKTSFNVQFSLEDLKDFDDAEATAKTIIDELQQRHTDLDLSYVSNGLVNASIKA